MERRTRGRALTTGEVAWVAAIPAVVLGLLAIALLGPPLGRALLTPEPVRFFDLFRAEVRPEPTEQGRYLLAAALPLLLAAIALVAGRRPSWRASVASDALVAAAQALLAGFVVVCLLQQRALLGPLYPASGPQPRLVDYFNGRTIVVALATLALVLALRQPATRERLTAWTRETPARALAAGAVALLALVLWLSPGIVTEDTIRAAHFQIRGTPEKRYSFENYFGTFPLRYAGPSLLAWLVARHLGGDRPRWPLFLAAGLVVLNNSDIGLGAAAATFVALLWAGGRPTWASLGRLAGATATGFAAAFALVSLLTLVREGALPELGLLMRFSRLFGLYGFAMFPLPRLGVCTSRSTRRSSARSRSRPCARCRASRTAC